MVDTAALVPPIDKKFFPFCAAVWSKNASNWQQFLLIKVLQKCKEKQFVCLVDRVKRFESRGHLALTLLQCHTIKF